MREYALLVPMPETEGRKSHPAKIHMPVPNKNKTSILLLVYMCSKGISWAFLLHFSISVQIYVYYCVFFERKQQGRSLLRYYIIININK
jgi:hypothetical protein